MSPKFCPFLSIFIWYPFARSALGCRKGNRYFHIRIAQLNCLGRSSNSLCNLQRLRNHTKCQLQGGLQQQTRGIQLPKDKTKQTAPKLFSAVKNLIRSKFWISCFETKIEWSGAEKSESSEIWKRKRMGAPK